MARRRYQRGYVFLRGKKGQEVWVGRYLKSEIQTDGSQRRVNRAVRLGTKSDFPTRKLAQRALEPYLNEVNDLHYRPTLVVSFRQFAEDWEKTILPTVRKDSYKKDIKLCLRVHLLPALGDKKIADIDSQTIQRTISQISPGRQRTVYMAFRKLWKTAGDWGYVKHEIKGIQFTPYRPKAPRFFTLDEVRKIFAAAEEPWKTLYWLAIETGLRIGELLALRWGNLDLESRVLMVEQSVWEGSFNDPKTVTGKRPVSLSLAVAQHLSTRRSSGQSGSTLLFATSRGTAYREGNILKRNHYPLLKSLGIPKGGFHAFRHASASFMDQLNTPIQIRQKRLGHADISTTMRYTHSISSDERKVSEELGAFLKLEVSNPSSLKSGPEVSVNSV